MPTPRRLATLLTAALLAAPVLSSCSGEDEDGADERTPQEVLAEAGTTLTESSGVELELSTDDLPAEVTGITRATGTATNAPAFEGTISVVLSGQQVDVPVIAVDDEVHAQLPFTQGWNLVDPEDYGAPDPAGLVDGDDGFPALLALTEGVEEGESVRGGTDNTEILTTYTGTVPGAAMKKVIPSSADSAFDVEWQITDDGELRRADLTGVFYAGSDEMTYTVTFDDYGTTRDITAP